MSRGKRMLEMVKIQLNEISANETQKVTVEKIPSLADLAPSTAILLEPNINEFQPEENRNNLNNYYSTPEPSCSNSRADENIGYDLQNDYDSESCDDDRDVDYVPKDSSEESENEPSIVRIGPKTIRLDNSSNLNREENTNQANEENKIEAANDQGRKRKSVNRKLMKEKKLKGEEYLTRKGILVPAKKFTPVISCCRKNCADKLPPESQKIIFDDFLKNVTNKDQVLSDRIKLSEKKIERKGRSKTGITRERQITASYFVTFSDKEINICKTMFQKVHSVIRGKVDILIQKRRACQTGFIDDNLSGRQKPVNAREEERLEVINHINSFPKYQSHYSRSHTSKLYLAPTLSIAKMYDMYVNKRKTEGMEKPLCYSMYAKIFNELGYKIKNPSIDTCKTCDKLQNDIKCAATEEERNKKVEEKDKHLELAEKAYSQKKNDKERARNSETERVIVFDLQQNLPTPTLTTSEVYYKRQLWTYNFTMRDCCTEITTCFMWHEALSDRGADQIASCIVHFLKDLPDSVNKVVLYSDSCPGQNKNNTVAAALSWFLHQSKNINIIEHKFLEVGHSRLECDSDHARIERAKKAACDTELRIPHDWYQFVRTVRGKKPFKVVEMQKEDFLLYSSLLRSVFVKRDHTEEGANIRWHDIKVLRFSKELPLGVIEVKYSHDENEQFCRLNIKRRGNVIPEFLPQVYDGPKPINPKKKENLVFLLKYIDSVYHPFYQNLTVNANAEDAL